MKICIICFKSYEKSNFKKYCSFECYSNPKYNHLKKNCFVANCNHCSALVLKAKSEIKGTNVFCNNSCSTSYYHATRNPNTLKRTKLICKLCQSEFIRENYRIIPDQPVFCSVQCSGRFMGIYLKPEKRSRLEIYIENKIRFYFPYLDMILNNREMLGLELDFYFPDLNLGIEINGPFHYTAFFSEKELQATQLRDERKLKSCNDKNIELFVVKATKKFTENFAEEIWKIIYDKLLQFIPYCKFSE